MYLRMLVPSPQVKSQQMKNVFTKTWRNDGELAGERLLKGTALLPRQRFVAVSQRTAHYTVHSLSHVSIPSVLRGSHPVDAELFSGIETSGGSFRRTL
jgi:hypothetical protein